MTSADLSSRSTKRLTPQAMSVLLATLAIAVLKVCLTLDFDAAGTVDGLGYLGNARFLGTGQDFVEAWERSPYRVGYSFVIVPVFWMFDDPATALRGVLVVNALFSALTLPIAYALVGRLTTTLSHLVRLTIASAAALYPPLMLYTNTAFSEAVLATIVLLWALTLTRSLRDPARCSAWVATGVVSGFMFVIHGRGLGPLGVICAASLVVGVRGRSWVPVIGPIAAAATIKVLAIPSVPNSARGLDSVRDSFTERLIEIPGTVLATVFGQTWSMGLATFGLPLFAMSAVLFVPAVRRLVSEQWVLWTSILAALISVLAISALFLSAEVVERSEVTFLIYERYNDANGPLLVVVALVLLMSTPFTRRNMLAILAGGMTLNLLVALGLFVAHGELLERPIFYLNVLSSFAYWDLGWNSLWQATTAMLLIGVILVLVVSRSPLTGALVVVALLGSVGLYTRDRFLLPYYGERSRQDQIARTVELIEPAQAVVYDRKVGAHFALYNMSWLLGDKRLEVGDVAPDTDLFVSTPELVASVPGARLVTLEDFTADYSRDRIGLYALAGETADRLKIRGWLAPEGFPTLVDSSYTDHVGVSVRLVGDHDGTFKSTDSPTVEVLNTGTVPLYSTRELRTSNGAFQIGIAWHDSAGEMIAEGRATVSDTLFPGQSEQIVLRFAKHDHLDTGTYDVVVGGVVEQHRWYLDFPARLSVEIS